MRLVVVFDICFTTRIACALCFTCTFKLNATYLPVDYLEPGHVVFLHISA